MRIIFILLITLSFASCAQNKKKLSFETPFQEKMNTEFKDASKSPLKSKDLKTFKSLDFFPFDSAFVVKATIKKTPDTEWFNMKTTTDRLSKERVFGILSFQLKGKSYQLNVYQGEELMQTEGFENYLFLPFLDNTNGATSYGGGRYIDLRVPIRNTVEIDFNSAYNPYCAYNEKFSCPIVPRINYLDLEVNVGVKAFVK
ncbi:DUF1684 domain-containing protein [Winogradskyella sp. UBA3174]|uniref:DUF1684 domain-containing protein n=1 Tax=Winogradskyella sp. UBA3174 TaxID=1947785 RepID=UPI0025CC7871|nr:DUF1684 domain-containing protein [Winogradskyella sp. UBA3174]|tara:strand:- start:94384 stop:94983 length:600 start_codon:yes stop_codon:yes gene_type:complete